MPRHQNTCGGLPPKASSLAFQFFCIWRSITPRYASHAARARSVSSVSPARSQPSKRGSSPAIFEMSMPAKSIPPSRSRRSIVLSSMPIWSSGVMSVVMAPFDALGIVWRQNGTSSTIEATVGPFSPIALKCSFCRSCAGAPKDTAVPRITPLNRR